MPTVPSFIADLGLTAVALFLFVAALWVVLQIVKAARNLKASPQPITPNGQHLPRCFESPIVSQLASVQASNTHLLEKMEEAAQDRSTTLALQTQLLERIAAVQEKIGDCIARQDAREAGAQAARARIGRAGGAQ